MTFYNSSCSAAVWRRERVNQLQLFCCLLCSLCPDSRLRSSCPSSSSWELGSALLSVSRARSEAPLVRIRLIYVLVAHVRMYSYVVTRVSAGMLGIRYTYEFRVALCDPTRRRCSMLRSAALLPLTRYVCMSSSRFKERPLKMTKLACGPTIDHPAVCRQYET